MLASDDNTHPFFHRGKRLFANIITMAPYSEGGVD